MMHYGKNVTGNERFFGFCVDILARVASEVGFEYILDLAPDRKYGAQDPSTGEWNGMVFQLQTHVSETATVELGSVRHIHSAHLRLENMRYSWQLTFIHFLHSFYC